MDTNICGIFTLTNTLSVKTVFIPTTLQEMKQLGWDQADIILVTGDSYIDSPYIGAAVIGKVLIHAGFRVGIIAQPDIHSPQDITRLGEPALFWGLTAVCIDSMVANYTATKTPRKSDDYTPGGINNRRPNRATIVYTNLIRRYYKNTVPVVLGGIEASLRRIAHYDFWSDQIRASVLFDSKADILVYGMAERTVVDLANHLRDHTGYHDLSGICYISKEPRAGYLELPSFATVRGDKKAFIEMFHLFYQNNDPLNAQGLVQQYDTRYLIQNPPPPYLTQEELDAVYALDYERSQHPYYESQGPVKALETIKTSIATHRGCYGECNFCAIAVHEGRTVRWRSQDSILKEARTIAALPDFKGYIHDLSGPTANMYGFECKKKLEKGSCKDKRCLYPKICSALRPDHSQQIQLLRKLRKIKGIKKIFVASGLRYDLLLEDKKHGQEYLKELVQYHTSGQLKIAPEHTQNSVLKYMGKPGQEPLVEFKDRFDQESKKAHKNQYLTYYLIAAHPGCTEADMRELKRFTSKQLKINPEQVQIFTPTPSTYSSLMYYTEIDPFTMQPIFVEKDPTQRRRQKSILTEKTGPHRKAGNHRALRQQQSKPSKRRA